MICMYIDIYIVKLNSIYFCVCSNDVKNCVPYNRVYFKNMIYRYTFISVFVAIIMMVFLFLNSILIL